MKNHETKQIREILESEPKPTWIHPDSTNDIWFVPRTGVTIDLNAPASSVHYAKIDFSYNFFDNSKGTDAKWTLFLTDLKSSAIALIESSVSKRPNSLAALTRTTFEIMDHVMEDRKNNNLPERILTLSDITINHIKDFLSAHDLIGLGINVSNLDAELGLTPRNRENILKAISTYKIPTITKKILIQQLKNQNAAAGEREFFSACKLGDCENLSVSTLENKGHQFSYLHKTKEHQAHKFEVGQHEITDAVSNASKSFTEKNQTPLMPTPIAFEYIANAIVFHRDYAPQLINYINSLETYYAENILPVYAKSTIKSNVDKFRRQAYEAIPIPPEIAHLNIKTFGRCSSARGSYTDHSILREHISTDELIGFYATTTRILIHTFTACRLLSASLLDADCLTLSKLDGLWDIKLNIPKSSDSNELEIIKRPIPQIIWNFISKYIDFMQCHHPNMKTIWPSESGKDTNRSKVTNRRLLDQYTDWIELPRIAEDRWYARPHQFRRFFAAFFLYLNSDCEIEPLRWMMGHIEPSITLYYGDISTQPEWESETLEFLKEFLSGHIDKEVIVDDTLKASFTSESIHVKLGDPALLSEHIRELSQHRQIKLKILNDKQIYIYAGK
ncbi:hypothetical protein [Pseudomonas sp. OV226]|uniref:hypothetical protein n=1 Tax=Pseudomonas sp. OV226 TaxID=2135588 RepID=UPI000D6B7F3B|nr:hypothetical protein [Pseudomonas sp. OV226]PWK30008.1 hypothetical protein C7534_13163 [Pseudomonas sp. OV226]